jgi:hypothetical protein
VYPSGTIKTRVWISSDEPAIDVLKKTYLVTKKTIPLHGGETVTIENLGHATFEIFAGESSSRTVALSDQSEFATPDNNGTLTLSAPDNTGYKTIIELVEPTPLQANTGDFDIDGVPDFADGISGVLTSEGHTPHDDGNHRERETALLHQIIGASEFENYPAGTTISVNYNISDPLQCKKISTPGNLTAEFSPAPGNLRIWKREPAFKIQNEVVPRSADDLILPNTQIPVSTLTNGLFIESVRPSATEGDHIVTITVNQPGGYLPEYHSFYFTSIAMTRLAVLPDGTLSRHAPFHRSLSNPTVEFDPIQVNNIRYDAESDSVLGDLVVSGKVRSDLCDMTPGERGKIESLALGVNSADFSDSIADVSVSKPHNPADRRRPFPYLGTFTKTLSGVPLEIGENVIEALAADPGTGNTGGGRAKFTVEAVAPSGAGGGLLVSNLTVAFPESDPTLVPGTIRIVAQDESGANLTSILAVDPADSLRYENSAGDVVLEFEEEPDLNAGEVDRNGAVVTVPALGWSEGYGFALKETGVSTGVLAGRDDAALLSMLDPSEWQISLGEIGASESDDPGEIYPVRILLEGPETLMETVEEIRLAEDNGTGAVRAVKDPIDGKFYAGVPEFEGAGPDQYVPGLFMAIAANLAGNQDGVLTKDDLITLYQRLEQMEQAPITEKLKFFKGFGYGAWIWGRDSVTDTAGTVAFVYKVTSPPSIIWEFTAGDSFQGEFAPLVETSRKAAEYGPPIAEFCWKAVTGIPVTPGENALLYGALIRGETTEAGAEYVMACDLLAAIVFVSAEELSELTHEERGVVYGYLWGECASIATATAIGAAAANAPGGAAGFSAKAAHSLSRLRAALQKLASDGRVTAFHPESRLFEVIDDFIEVIVDFEKIDNLWYSSLVSRILKKYRDQAGPDATWLAVVEAAKPDLQKEGLWRGEMVRGIETLITDDFNKRLVANGGDYSILPTHSYLTRKVIGQSGTKEFNSHHICIEELMKWIHQNFTLPNVPLKRNGIDFDVDKTPATPLWDEEHQVSSGGVRGTIHDVLETQTVGTRITSQYLNKTFPDLDKSEVSNFLDRIARQYSDPSGLNMPGIGAAFRRWYSDRGI